MTEDEADREASHLNRESGWLARLLDAVSRSPDS